MDYGDVRDVKERSGSLLLNRIMHNCFHACERCAAPYLNIVALFYMDFIRILEGYYLRKCEIRVQEEEVKNTLSRQGRDKRKSFSDLIDRNGCNYIPLLVNKNRRKSVLKVVCEIYSQCMGSRKRIAVNPPVGNIYDITCQCFKRRYGVYFVDYDKLYIPLWETQWNSLAEVLRAESRVLFESHEIELLLRIMYKHLQAHSAQQEVPFPYDIVVSGSLLERKRRFVAAMARVHDKPVICVSHGEGDYFIVDEPRTGAEITYATHIVGYGRKGKDVLDESPLSHGFYQMPVYVPSNSNIVKSVYINKRVRKCSDFGNSPSYMYVPTGFMGNIRYSSIVSVSDKAYYDWQLRINEMFPNVVYKAHPKNKVSKPLEFIYKEVLYGNLSQCLDRADIYIFDIVTSAFNIAAATDKPIIYFDIGLRNYNKSVYEVLKKRCIWIEVKGKSNEAILREYGRLSGETRENLYTSDYCITEMNETRESTIVSTIETCLTQTER